jgi:hypothetical protein
MKISTKAKLISTALVAAAIVAPIAHGETDGTLLTRASQNAVLAKTNPGTVSDGTLLSKAADLPGHQSSSASYPRLKVGEGFSFKAPSYWNAAPSYWRTVERTLAPRTPRVSVNRSLGVPPQYLGSTAEQVSIASSGFDWVDAGVGAAFVAGLGAIGLGAFVAVRRRHGLAELEA